MGTVHGRMGRLQLRVVQRRADLGRGGTNEVRDIRESSPDYLPRSYPDLRGPQTVKLILGSVSAKAIEAPRF